MITKESNRRKRPLFSYAMEATNTNIAKASPTTIRVACACVLPTIAAIRAGRTDLKKKLPAVCWAAYFKDGHRHAESAEPTGLAYIDIDHVYDNLVKVSQVEPSDESERLKLNGHYARCLYGQLFSGFEEDLGIVHAQISPSGDGLHIVFIPRVGNSIEEAQKAFAEDSGLQFYDAQCKDISRLLFLSSAQDTLFDALDTLAE